LSDKAAQDSIIMKYIKDSSSILPHTYPSYFLKILPQNILNALVNVRYSSDDHSHIIKSYSVPLPVEIVMKYTSFSVDEGWRQLRWPSIVGFVHPAVIRALYNGYVNWICLPRVSPATIIV
jgi:hypothetical protein